MLEFHTEALAGSLVKQVETSIPQRGLGVAAGVGKVEPDGLGSRNSDGEHPIAWQPTFISHEVASLHMALLFLICRAIP